VEEGMVYSRVGGRSAEVGGCILTDGAIDATGTAGKIGMRPESSLGRLTLITDWEWFCAPGLIHFIEKYHVVTPS
jgi:hypothetical protein